MVEEVPSYISWIKYLAFTTYPYQALLRLEYDGTRSFLCDTSSDFDVCLNSTHISDHDVIEKYKASLTFGESMLLLLAFGVIFAVVAFIGMKRTTPKMQLLFTADGDMPVGTETTTNGTPLEVVVTISQVSKNETQSISKNPIAILDTDQL